MYLSYWILVVIFPQWLVYGDIVQLKQIQESSVIHKRLLNHVFNRTRGDDPQHCLADCFHQHDQCQSFNFDAMSDICELNNATHLQFPTDYIDAHLFVYFNNVIFGMRAPAMGRHSLDISEPGPCDSFPCQNGGLCSLTEDLDFRCVNCSAGFYGKMCEMYINPCWPEDPCINGKCKVNSSNLSVPICECFDGYDGSFCEINSIGHRFDITPHANSIPILVNNITTNLTEMTLCIWYSTKQLDTPQYLLSYIPNNTSKPERIIIWRKDHDIHVKLELNHHEYFLNHRETVNESGAVDATICLAVNTVLMTLKLYIAGTLRAGIRTYNKGPFQLSPGKLYLGYYKHPTEGDKYFDGSLSGLYLWSEEKQEAFLTFNRSVCESGLNKANIIWDWNRKLLDGNISSSISFWDVQTVCTKRPVRIHDFGSLYTSAIGVYTKNDLDFVLTTLSVGMWVRNGKNVLDLRLALLDLADQIKAQIDITPNGGYVKLTIYSISVSLPIKLAFYNSEWHLLLVSWTGESGQVRVYVDGKQMCSKDNFQNDKILQPVKKLKVQIEGLAHLTNLNIWSYNFPVLYSTSMAYGSGYDVGDVFAWKMVNKSSSSFQYSSVFHKPAALDDTVDAIEFKENQSLSFQPLPVSPTYYALVFWYKLPSTSDVEILSNSYFGFRVQNAILQITKNAETRDLGDYSTANIGVWRQVIMFFRYDSNCPLVFFIDGIENRTICNFIQQRSLDLVWVINPAKSIGLQLAYFNVWYCIKYDCSAQRTCQIYEKAGMMASYGNLISWKVFKDLAKQSPTKFNVVKVPELQIPDAITQTARNDYCVENYGSGGPCKIKHAKAGFQHDTGFGLFCVCNNQVDTFQVLKHPISSSALRVPELVNITGEL